MAQEPTTSPNLRYYYPIPAANPPRVIEESAATAAALAIDENIAVQKVSYEKLKLRLLQDKQVLVWTGGPTKK